MKKQVKDGMLGLMVGDALGVPVEFTKRSWLKNDLVMDMREYGTHHQPKGTWSDDSSMALASLDSLCDGYDLEKMMDAFAAWFFENEYTPYGEVFDNGIATADAMYKYRHGFAPIDCGGIYERSNGNGSLMRMLPTVFYALKHSEDMDGFVKMIEDSSKLTHAHDISLMGCVIYGCIVKALLEDRENIEACLQKGIDEAFGYYQGKKYLKKYERLMVMETFKKIEEEDISSSGFIVSTLEAALWCLLHTNNFKDCVLKAVNLGDDTDTVGAVAGSLAGLVYGYQSIPTEWLEVLARKEWVDELLEKFADSLE